jgi:hypothetical protein
MSDYKWNHHGCSIMLLPLFSKVIFFFLRIVCWRRGTEKDAFVLRVTVRTCSLVRHFRYTCGIMSHLSLVDRSICSIIIPDAVSSTIFFIPAAVSSTIFFIPAVFSVNIPKPGSIWFVDVVAVRFGNYLAICVRANFFSAAIQLPYHVSCTTTLRTRLGPRSLTASGSGDV